MTNVIQDMDISNAEAISWNSSLNILLIGAPLSDHVYEYQLHPELVNDLGEEKELVCQQVRCISLQQAGYKIQNNIILARDALYQFLSDSSTLKHLPVDLNDGFKLAHEGDVFNISNAFLIVVKHRDNTTRIDLFHLDNITTFKLYSSIIPVEETQDFGFNVFMTEEQQVAVSCPSLGRLYFYTNNNTASTTCWTLTETLDFTDIEFYNTANVSLWKDVIVVSVPDSHQTYLYDLKTKQKTKIIQDAGHHKVSNHELVTWKDTILTIHSNNNNTAQIQVSHRIIDVEILNQNDFIVLMEYEGAGMSKIRKITWFRQS